MNLISVNPHHLLQQCSAFISWSVSSQILTIDTIWKYFCFTTNALHRAPNCYFHITDSLVRCLTKNIYFNEILDLIFTWAAIIYLSYFFTIFCWCACWLSINTVEFVEWVPHFLGMWGIASAITILHIFVYYTYLHFVVQTVSLICHKHSHLWPNSLHVACSFCQAIITLCAV